MTYDVEIRYPRFHPTGYTDRGWYDTLRIVRSALNAGTKPHNIQVHPHARPLVSCADPASIVRPSN